MKRFAERHESLWWLVAGPAVWTVHFVLSYATVAIWCARIAPADRALGSAGTAVVVYTLVALGALVPLIVRAWIRMEAVPDHVGHDLDTTASRHRFLAFASLLLAGLSAVAILFEATVPFTVGTCR